MVTKSDGTFVLIHDKAPDHPKFVGLSDAAFRLWVHALCYCSRYLTDGLVPEAMWQRLGTRKARDELLAAQLVEQSGESFAVHDYLDWQISADDAAARKANKSKAGQRGNHERWHQDRRVPGCPQCQAEPDITGAITGAIADSLTGTSQFIADTDTDTDTCPVVMSSRNQTERGAA